MAARLAAFLTVLGACAVVYGVSLLSVAAAWIVGGLVLASIGTFFDFEADL